MTQLRLLTIPRSHLRFRAQQVRFKHNRKRSRQSLADKSKEQLAQQLADTKRKLRDLQSEAAQEVNEAELTKTVESEPKRWQFWKRRAKALSEQEVQEKDEQPSSEVKVPTSFRFAKEPEFKVSRYAKEPEFKSNIEWKTTRTAKDHSQKTKMKQSHWGHRLTTDPGLSKALEEYEELRIQVEEAERKFEEKKAQGKPVKINENARLGLRLIVHGERRDYVFFRLPRFVNRAIPIPNIPLTAARKKQVDEEQERKDQEREEKSKDEPRKYKKYFAIPLILFLYDWYRKKDAIRKIAKKIQAPFEIEMIQLRRILRLSNDELLQFHAWLCDHGKTELTVDEFGLEFAKAVAHFHIQTPPHERPLVAELLEEAPPVDGEFRVRRTELFPWDLAFMWRNHKGTCETKLPLWQHFCGISHYVYDDLEQKAAVGFLVLDYEQSNGQGVSFNDVCSLMQVMVDTGHFESEALIERTSWLPHEFIIRDNKRMAEIMFAAADLKPKTDRMTISDFEKALLYLGWSKWYEFGRPEMRTWYTSKAKQKSIQRRDKQREKERKQKEDEARATQLGESSWWLKIKAFWPFDTIAKNSEGLNSQLLPS